ncbi:MAG: L,D-transpeptidase [Holophaga sp.]|nr:L,D-transpeptidase [Holophaga sp.]
MPPSFGVPFLAAVPGCRGRDGRPSRRGGKVASGGLPGYTGASVFEKHCGTRESAPCGWEVRWGAALAQTGDGDLPPVPGSVTLPNGGKGLANTGEGTTDASVVVTPGGGEKDRRLPRTNGKEILIDLEAQNLSAYDKKKLVYEFDVVTGDKDHPTSPGRFKIYRKENPYRSKKYNAQMDYAMFFDGGNAIHQYHGPFGLVSLGRGVSDWFGSHGCVRLAEENARTLYQWAPKGTAVEVF